MGEQNTLTNSTKSIIGGINNSLTATNMSIVLGGYNASDGTTTSTIVGTENTINGDSNFVIGNLCRSSEGADAVTMVGRSLSTSVGNQTLIGSLNDQTVSDNDDFRVIIGTGSGSNRFTAAAFSEQQFHAFATPSVEAEAGFYHHVTINPCEKSIQFGRYRAPIKEFLGTKYIFDYNDASSASGLHVACKEEEVYSNTPKILSSYGSLDDVLVSGTYYINSLGIVGGPVGPAATGDLMVVFSPGSTFSIGGDLNAAAAAKIVTQEYYLANDIAPRQPYYRRAYKSNNR